jgi:hypothetical protein
MIYGIGFEDGMNVFFGLMSTNDNVPPQARGSPA